ncbi:MAG: hypothetical protein Q9166_000509 [cf. Caloplaca sp. 2 TL-2023]
MRLRSILPLLNHIHTCRRCRTFSSSSKVAKGDRRLSQKLPSSPARTRFAPSPTGYLHLGSLRTALFNYLLARATGGKFLLRIEDTDKKRTIADAEERLYSDLRWAGLQWDEEYAKSLLDSGHAYRCFCSEEKLYELARRRASLGLPTDYDRTCEGILREQSDERAASGHRYVLRLRVPSEPPEYVDLVYGSVGKQSQNKTAQNLGRKAQSLGEVLHEDPILLKSDGLPTYHLANVVDDHHMKITHVVRAAEWMSSTPKHLIMYNALGWKAPEYAHVGLLQDSDRQKFSKRKGDLDIRKFADEGIFPEALLNYVTLYGWSHDHKSDVLSLAELVAHFKLKFTRGNTIVEPHKLMYLQKKHAANYADEGGQRFEALVDRVFEAVQQEFKAMSWFPESDYANSLQGEELRTRIAAVLKYTAKNYTTPRDFFHNYKYLFCDVPLPEPVSTNIVGERQVIRRARWMLYKLLNNVSPADWNEATLKEAISEAIDYVEKEKQSNDLAIDADRKMIYRGVQLYLRWGIARGGSGPPMHTTMALLGRAVSLERLHELATLLDEKEESKRDDLAK